MKGHALVFLEQLSGIPALAVVLPVARLPTEILAPLPTTAATAAALTIVDQMPTSLRSVACPLLSSDRQGRAVRRHLPSRSGLCAEALEERPIASGVGTGALCS